MVAIESINEELKQKIEKVAMHKLIPNCIKYFKDIPLTVAGKIRLSRFPKESLEYAISTYDKSLSPKDSYDDIVSISETYCYENYRVFNDEAVEFLSRLFGINESMSSIRNKPLRPELIPYVEPYKKKKYEPVYVSFFKLRDHLNNKKLPFPNPFEKRYEEYLSEALESIDIDRAVVEKELYRLYLIQKEKDVVCDKGKTSSVEASSNVNCSQNTCL